ncbi:type II toxin-antitoxin system RelE/ParE family toxin [Vibrio parahaemolyticus]|uniref:type II toxin-antitoxin system RelE/ParE family toxin n=1 Tax=Vibrio antiquarius (strain Ex25) TaxID=150340 RepID=UPI00265AECD8|nr:type II toxin-antitoxin system RelE/ParE family toxin [Vibrio antiquarius]
MDYTICINQNSFPADNAELGRELFDNAIAGVLELHSDNDRFLFFLDSNDGDLSDLVIADGLTFEEYRDSHTDQDLVLFLHEIEDKSPALDSLTAEQLDEMTAYSFYVPDEAVDNFTDVYGLSWALSGFLLSLASAPRWETNEIKICRADEEGRYVDEILTLKNISCQDHGIAIFDAANQRKFEDIVSPHVLTDDLSNWFQEQSEENKSRIIDKVELAVNREFNGGEPLFKTLNGADGIREIRIPAYSGGAIRILFKHMPDEKQALLVGFIKKSDGEGYTQATKVAKELYAGLTQ